MSRLGFVVLAGCVGASGPAAPPPAPTPRPPPAPVEQTVTPELPTPALEITRTLDAAAAFPAVPTFELPPPEPGFVDTRTLRAKGRKLLDTKIAVKGYIIWIYNCVDAVRLPKESKAKTQKRIDEDPTLCERPKFYLGSTQTTPPEKALWVVDVPRPPNKLEKLRLPKEEIKNWPKVPTVKLGDFVVVTGEFKMASPHNERNSDGLLVFESIAPATPAKPQPASPPTSVPARPAPTKPQAITLAPIDPATFDASKIALARGNRAHGTRQYAEAIKAYREALSRWPQNHLAFYGLGGSLASQGDWPGAYEAFRGALAVRPDAAMYQMWAGVAAYEKTVYDARASEARKQDRDPSEVSVDLASLAFDDARRHLELAATLEPGLWRAHYYLGRVYRNGDEPRLAAEEFTQAARANPVEQGPWVALTELYRRWDYTKEAIAVGKLGTSHVPERPSSSDVWFVLGMAHDDALDYAAEIEAFEKAIDLDRDNHKARFQRGQAYARLGKWDEARDDLEAFAKAAGPALEFAKQQAAKMLMDIAARKPAKKK